MNREQKEKLWSDFQAKSGALGKPLPRPVLIALFAAALFAAYLLLG